MLARGRKSALLGGKWYGPPLRSGSPHPPIASSGIALEIPMQSSLPRRAHGSRGMCSV